MKGDAADNRLKKMLANGRKLKITKNNPTISNTVISNNRKQEYQNVRSAVFKSNSPEKLLEIIDRYGIKPNERYNHITGDTIMHKIINCITDEHEEIGEQFLQLKAKQIKVLMERENDINICNSKNKTILDILDEPKVKEFWQERGCYDMMKEFLKSVGAKRGIDITPQEKKYSSLIEDRSLTNKLGHKRASQELNIEKESLSSIETSSDSENYNKKRQVNYSTTEKLMHARYFGSGKSNNL